MMPEPNLTSGVTTRRGLRGTNTSPAGGEGGGGGGGSGRGDGGGVGAGRSPRARLTKTHAHNKSGGRVSSDGEYSDDNVDDQDEVDRVYTHSRSPHLYPDLSSAGLSPKRSPGSPSSPGSPTESLDTSRSSCHSRTGPRTVRSPATHSPDSPRRRLYSDLNEDKKAQHRGAGPVMAIFIFTVIFISGIFLYQILNDNEDLKPKEINRIKPIEEVYSDLKTYLKTLNQETSQSREFLVQLLGQLGSIMVEEPKQPAVILVVVTKDSRKTAACLIHSLARAVKDAFEDTKFVMHDVISSSLSDPAQLKVELDHSLQGLASAHAAVVHNIELVPGSSAMIFHAYCDNENAPYKQALILPVLEVPLEYSKVSKTRLDEYVTETLNRLWGAQLQQKDVAAIVSRIANSPVLVKPELPHTIEALCKRV